MWHTKLLFAVANGASDTTCPEVRSYHRHVTVLQITFFGYVSATFFIFVAQWKAAVKRIVAAAAFSKES
jgi:hypothetical protein